MDREFRGSFSIKSVAPALLGAEFSYDDLSVGAGMDAGLLAEQLLRGLLRGGELESACAHLLEYCRHDTRGLVELFGWMGSPK
jgi:hypothetical protein